jgi:hypothetical protein
VITAFQRSPHIYRCQGLGALGSHNGDSLHNFNHSIIFSAQYACVEDPHDLLSSHRVFINSARRAGLSLDAYLIHKMAPSRCVGLLALVSACLLPSGVLALWPIPTTLQTGTTALKVSPSFYFDVQVPDAPADLYEAVGQAQYYLETDQLGRLVVGRGANDTAALTSANTLSSLTLSLTSGATVEPIASEAVKPLGTRTEEYSLTIPADGSAATLTANSTLGLYRGLTTFNQLFYYYGGVTYTLLAPIAITDMPAYVSSYHITFDVSCFNLMHIALPRTWSGYIEELLPHR